MTCDFLALPAAPLRPDDRQVYLSRVQRKAEALLRAAAFDLRAWSVAVRATPDGDGRLSGVAVVRSAGSRDIDRIVERALAYLFVAGAPAALVGRALTLDLGAASPAAAAP